MNNIKVKLYVFAGIGLLACTFLGIGKARGELTTTILLVLVNLLYWVIGLIYVYWPQNAGASSAAKPEPKWEHMPPPRRRDVLLDPQTAKIIAKRTLKLASGYGKCAKFVLIERKHSTPIFDSEPELDISEYTSEKNQESSTQGSKGQGNVTAPTSPPIHLVDCPACGHKVSNYARACPNCGHPLTQAVPSNPTPVYRDTTPRCPTCGSTDIKKLDSLDRTISATFWGLGSGKIGKQFKCRHCGYMW